MEEQYENLKIGSQIFAVHKKYPDEGLMNGKIIVCRVKTFENRSGKIMPVLSEVGNARRIINPETHYIYVGLAKAIDAIRTQ